MAEKKSAYNKINNDKQKEESANKRDNKNKEKSKVSNKGNKKKIIAVSVFIVIILLIIFGAYQYYYPPETTTSFSTFESNFNSAPNIAIVVSAENSTELSYAINCEISLIETLTSSHINHKAPSAISIYVMNQTKCIYLNGLGSATGNYITISPSECLNMTNNIPTIFINYSSKNSTVIKPYKISFSGNSKFLESCGIAPELTSGS